MDIFDARGSSNDDSPGCATKHPRPFRRYVRTTYEKNIQTSFRKRFLCGPLVVLRYSIGFHPRFCRVFLPNYTGGTRFVNGHPVRVSSSGACSALNAISKTKPVRFSALNRRFRVWNSRFLLQFTPLWTFPSFSMMCIFCTCEIPSLSVRLVPSHLIPWKPYTSFSFRFFV